MVNLFNKMMERFFPNEEENNEPKKINFSFKEVSEPLNLDEIDDPSSRKKEEKGSIVKLRPVRLHFLVKVQDKDFKPQARWERDSEPFKTLKKEIKSKSGLNDIFKTVKLTDYTLSNTPNGWKEIKIILGKGGFNKGSYFHVSQAIEIYSKVLENMLELMKSSSKVESRLSGFWFMERYHPPEPTDIVPLDELQPVMKKAWKKVNQELQEFKSTKWYKKNYKKSGKENEVE